MPTTLQRFSYPTCFILAFCCSFAAAATLPTLEVETVATPVIAARNWTQAMAPTADGGWDFITQYYNYKYGRNDAEHPPQWLVVDLATGRQKSISLPGYANTNYNLKNQLRTANGRIFFAAYGNRFHYYDPTERTVKTIGQLIPSKEESGYATFYRMTIGPDGKLYATSQANNTKVALARIDPDTLERHVWLDLGSPEREEGLTYGYYHAADPPWVYIGAGKGDWRLIAVNTDTGEQRILAGPASWMSFNVTAFGVRVSMNFPADPSVDLQGEPSVWIGSTLHTAKGSTRYAWCRDGVLYDADAAQENPDIPGMTLAERWPTWQRRPVATPEVQLGEPDHDGNVTMQWKPADADAWRSVAIKTTWAEPIHLESLTTLPDGRIMGNARQYHGFFIYDPASGATETFGRHGPSGPAYATANGKLFFSGYPTCNAWVFDPTQPWKTGENPRTFGYFGTSSGAHYAYFMFTDPEQSRLYCIGRCERGATGTGASYYDFAAESFHGNACKHPYLKPRGAVYVPGSQNVVLSGLLVDSPYGEAEKPAKAQLIVMDRDLNDLRRLTVKPGLISTGRLYLSKTPGQIIGHINDDGVHALYRYDLKRQSLLAWSDLAQPSSSLFHDGDGTLWTVGEEDNVLYRLDTDKLILIPVAQLARPIGLPQFRGRQIFGTSEDSLLRVSLP